MNIQTLWKRLREVPSPFGAEIPVKKAVVLTPAKSHKKNLKTKEERRNERRASDEKAVKDATLSFALIALAAKLANIDGKLSHKEIDSFKRIFPETYSPSFEVGKFFGEACNDNVGFEYYARRITTYFPGNHELYKKLLYSLFEFAEIDGPLNIEEIHYLQQVNGIFGLGEKHFLAVVEDRIMPLPRDPFVVLGIDIKASEKTIKTAYRAAAQAYHPDRLAMLSIPEKDGLIKIANRRFNAIQSAYDRIRKLRGISGA